MSVTLKSFSLAKPALPKLDRLQGYVDKAHLSLLSKFFAIKSQKGVTMIEYALIASLVAVGAIAALTTLGTDLSSQFNYIGGKVLP